MGNPEITELVLRSSINIVELIIELVLQMLQGGCCYRNLACKLVCVINRPDKHIQNVGIYTDSLGKEFESTFFIDFVWGLLLFQIVHKS